MSAIKFSVLLPTRNRRELAVGAITTVRRQTYPDWELIVADNSSTESVEPIVREIGDPRIHYTRAETPVTVTANWNRALDAASGDWVVMLGDDDGLVPGYFERCLDAISALDPEFLYHAAWHFGFPGVFAQYPQGYLREIGWFTENCHDRRPALLDLHRARAAGRHALEMRADFGFNMQHFLFSRSFLRRLASYGAVFRGPFPDFYTANLAMLIGERIAVIADPLVIIGISPKSYGAFHVSGRESEGISFLQNDGYAGEAPEPLRARLLPGSHMNTAWLLSVALVAEALRERPDISLGVSRYRRLQIHRLLREEPPGPPSAAKRDLWRRLGASEKAYARMLASGYAIARRFPAAIRERLIQRIERFDRQYEPPVPPSRRPPEPRARDVADVFQRLLELGRGIGSAETESP